MTRNIIRTWVSTFAGILILSATSQADTLRMHNGQVLSGTYQGGAKDTVRFQEKKDILEYPIAAIQLLNFGETTSSQTPQQNLLSLPAGKHLMIEKNGQIVLGLYLGGTKDTVRFQGENGVQEYSIVNMLVLIFSQAAASQTSKPVSQTQAATQEQDVVTLPVGTGLMVRLNETLQSDKNQTGDSFLTILETDLAVNGLVIAPRGTRVFGKITEAKKGQRLAKKAKIAITLSNIEIDRQLYPLVTSGYEASGDRQGTLLKTGTSALIGGAIDGEDGAKTGAAVGVGVSVVTKGNQIQIPKDALLEFSLQETATVPIARLTSPVAPSRVDSDDVPALKRENLPASRPTKGRGRLRR